MSNKIIESSLEKQNNLQMATFAAGCFWGVEEAFRQVKGVKSTTVGYTGGRFENPTYKDVCTHKTGHAEALLIQFDPNQVSYKNFLMYSGQYMILQQKIDKVQT
jgi:peptide-methionine (S)-S-oxide reductase